MGQTFKNRMINYAKTLSFFDRNLLILTVSLVCIKIFIGMDDFYRANQFSINCFYILMSFVCFNISIISLLQKKYLLMFFYFFSLLFFLSNFLLLMAYVLPHFF